MAGNVRNTRWRSDLTLHGQDDDAASSKSSNCEDDKPNQTSVGPFMCDLFEKQLYTDVEFVSKHTKESVSAHRAVLAAKCSHFQSLLFGQQKNGVTGMKLQIEIKHKPFRVFKDIIEYLYTDSIQLSNISYVLNVRAVAIDIDIEPLLVRCEEYIDTFDLNEDNVCSTLQLASEKYLEELREKCIEYIKENTSQVISSPDFEKCSFSTAREICDLQDLNLESESQILEASLRWINVQPDHTRSVLKKSIMKCIRFLSFSRQEFGDLVKRYQDMLSSSDALAILMYLNDSKSININELPDWINRGQRTFKRDIRRCVGGPKRILQIPLKPPTEPDAGLTHLTSVLQMHCIKGSQRIDAVTFSLAERPPPDSHPLLVIMVIVKPRRYQFRFDKTIDSQETTIAFASRLYVSCGNTIHMKVQFRCSVPCRFLRFDDSALPDFQNEHFECSLTSHPAKGRFFVIGEIEYSNRPLPNFSRRKRKPAKVDQTEKKK